LGVGVFTQFLILERGDERKTDQREEKDEYDFPEGGLGHDWTKVWRIREGVLFDLRGNGFLCDLDLDVFGDAQDESIILDSSDGTVHSAYGFDLGSLFQSLEHFRVLFLFLALRGDQQKPKGDED